MRNFYSVLHVAPKASDAEIKGAFRNLAKTCHPDVKPGDRGAEATFQEVERAYKFLSNPETRKIYDAFLASRRALARRRLRRAATTMSASCILTSATILLAMLWIQQDGPSLSVIHDLAKATAHAGTVEEMRVAAPPPSPSQRRTDAVTEKLSGP